MRRLGLLVTLLVLSACGSTTVDAPPPETSSEAAPELPAVELPPSYVSAPIVFDLRPFLAGPEETIPRKFGSVEKDKRIKLNDGPNVWADGTSPLPALGRGAVTLPDLSFDVNTTTALGKTVGWLFQGPLLGLIQEYARIPAADLLAKDNRALSDGVHLRGSFSGANTRAVQATPVGLVARAQATGRLWVEISKEDLLPGGKQ